MTSQHALVFTLPDFALLYALCQCLQCDLYSRHMINLVYGYVPACFVFPMLACQICASLLNPQHRSVVSCSVIADDHSVHLHCVQHQVDNSTSQLTADLVVELDIPSTHICNSASQLTFCVC